MFGQPARLEHVAELLLAPAAARLGGVAERVDELGGLARDALVARAHRLDLAVEDAERVAALGLDLLDALLVTLEAFVDGLEELAELLARGTLRLGEAGVGTFQELVLRGGERLGGGVAELRGELFARVA